LQKTTGRNGKQPSSFNHNNVCTILTMQRFSIAKAIGRLTILLLQKMLVAFSPGQSHGETARHQCYGCGFSGVFLPCSTAGAAGNINGVGKAAGIARPSGSKNQKGHRCEGPELSTPQD
jgi:hypothetical protein